MPDERRKGSPDRRRSRSAKSAASSVPDVPANEQQRPADANEAAANAADELDASIRARKQEDWGEVF